MDVTAFAIKRSGLSPPPLDVAPTHSVQVPRFRAYGSATVFVWSFVWSGMQAEKTNGQQALTC